LQDRANPETIATQAIALLTSRPAIDRMRHALAELRPRLGRPGASERAAEAVLDLLDRRSDAA
jgi:lipid A disaccharide synthetase